MIKCVTLCLFSVAVPVVHAQYSVNWPTQPATPMATDVMPGTQTLKVSGVNDFLYTYEINVVEIQTPIAIPALPTGGPHSQCADTTTYGHAADPVMNYFNDAETALQAYKGFLPATAAPSQKLADTQSAWTKNVKPAINTATADAQAAQNALATLSTDPPKTDCQQAVKEASTILDTLNNYDLKLNTGTHEIQATFAAKACTSDILTVVEKYNGVPTNQTISVRLDAECNELTVSGGVLLSEIQNRTYTSSQSPSQSGNYLSVGGTGKFSPTLTSLFNFNFPLQPLGQQASHTWGDVGLGISTGPVLQLSSSQASAFGWFAGGTVSFFHLFYLTPGEHFGQFADYPDGFKANQKIPANFGQLTPVKRWTGRFGFAITLKGWNVSKALSTGGTSQPTPSPK